MTEAEDGAAVLLDERAGRYWQLNPSGAVVLRTLLESGTAREAARVLTQRYPVSPEQAVHDVAELAAQLLSANLVERSSVSSLVEPVPSSVEPGQP